MTDFITPPRELMEQWASEKCYDERDWLYEFHIATRAAQWGADQELEACLFEASFFASRSLADRLRAARRPKLPSLKQDALSLLAKTDGPVMLGNPEYRLRESEVEIIRRALEALDD
jgi:hypothetical protein